MTNFRAKMFKFGTLSLLLHALNILFSNENEWLLKGIKIEESV